MSDIEEEYNGDVGDDDMSKRSEYLLTALHHDDMTIIPFINTTAWSDFIAAREIYDTAALTRRTAKMNALRVAEARVVGKRTLKFQIKSSVGAMVVFVKWIIE